MNPGELLWLPSARVRVLCGLGVSLPTSYEHHDAGTQQPHDTKGFITAG